MHQKHFITFKQHHSLDHPVRSVLNFLRTQFFGNLTTKFTKNTFLEAIQALIMEHIIDQFLLKWVKRRAIDRAIISLLESLYENN